MAGDTMNPGQFYPAQFDLSTAVQQMRAMREQASAAADQVRRAGAGLKQSVSGALKPAADVSALAVGQQTQARRLAQQTMEAQRRAAGPASEQWDTMLSPVSEGFENVTRTALAGTGHMSKAWRAMGRDMVVSLVRMHAEALLMGGEEGSLLSSVFGSREQGGGLSGLAGGLLLGRSYDAGVVGRALGLGAPQASGEMFSSLGATAEAGARAPETELPAGAGVLPGADLTAAGVADDETALSTLPQEFSRLSESAAGLPDTFTQVADSASGLPGVFGNLSGTLEGLTGGGAGGGGALGAAGSLFGSLFSAGALFGFARGGIVPSAAGGMIVGAGHGTLAMLHPREMVLPAGISGGLERMIGGANGAAPAAHNVSVNYHVNALDARSVRSLLEEHGGTIANALQRALRDSPRGGSGFQIT